MDVLSWVVSQFRIKKKKINTSSSVPELSHHHHQQQPQQLTSSAASEQQQEQQECHHHHSSPKSSALVAIIIDGHHIIPEQKPLFSGLTLVSRPSASDVVAVLQQQHLDQQQKQQNQQQNDDAVDAEDRYVDDDDVVVDDTVIAVGGQTHRILDEKTARGRVEQRPAAVDDTVVITDKGASSPDGESLVTDAVSDTMMRMSEKFGVNQKRRDSGRRRFVPSLFSGSRRHQHSADFTILVMLAVVVVFAIGFSCSGVKRGRRKTSRKISAHG